MRLIDKTGLSLLSKNKIARFITKTSVLCVVMASVGLTACDPLGVEPTDKVFEDDFWTNANCHAHTSINFILGLRLPQTSILPLNNGLTMPSEMMKPTGQVIAKTVLSKNLRCAERYRWFFRSLG